MNQWLTNSSSNNSRKLLKTRKLNNFTIANYKQKWIFLGIFYSINYNRLLYSTCLCFILKTITTFIFLSQIQFNSCNFILLKIIQHYFLRIDANFLFITAYFLYIFAYFLRINANFKLIITCFLHIIARSGLFWHFCFLSAHYYLFSAHYCLLSADFSYLVRIIACFLCILAYFLRHIANFLLIAIRIFDFFL